MGEFRKFRSYYASNALRFNASYWYYSTSTNGPYAMTRVPNFKDILGNEYYWLINFMSTDLRSSSTISNISGTGDSETKGNCIAQNYQVFSYLKPFATADLISNYSIDDYEIVPIGTTHYTRAHFVAEDVNKVLYSMSIFNNTEEDITVSCIKFRKLCYVSTSTSQSYSSAYTTESAQTDRIGVYALFVAYYLDEPVTIAPGQSHLISLSFETSQF